MNNKDETILELRGQIAMHIDKIRYLKKDLDAARETNRQLIDAETMKPKGRIHITYKHRPEVGKYRCLK